MSIICRDKLRETLKLRQREISDKIIIGLTERVRITGNDHAKEFTAKIDTGATKSSIDINLAAELNLGPVKKTRLVKSAHGHRIRPVVEARLEMAGQRLNVEFTLADRAHMSSPVLIGQNVLKKGFIIDPNREANTR